MSENTEISQRKALLNGDSKVSSNKFSKTLTSFHTSKKKAEQNATKKSVSINQKNNPKSKKVYFSGKKKNNLGYIVTNPMSPLNNYKYKGIYNNPIRTTNIPNSAQRVYDYKNGYILNNINNYHTNIIINSNIKENKSNSLNQRKIKNNENKNISKKTNGASDNNINNNSLIHSSENFLKTIAITLTNNENNIKSNNLKFNGINGNITTYKYNKSQSNFNEFKNINSRDKILKKVNGKNSQNKQKENNNQIKKNSLINSSTNINKNTNKFSSNQINNTNSLRSSININKKQLVLVQLIQLSK